MNTMMVWAGIKIGSQIEPNGITGSINPLQYEEKVIKPVIISYRIQLGLKTLLIPINLVIFRVLKFACTQINPVNIIYGRSQ